ncbi:unnamed protein product, partial [Porites lobata]
ATSHENSLQTISVWSSICKFTLTDHLKMNRPIVAAFLVSFACSILTDQVWSARLNGQAQEKPGLCPKPRPGQVGPCVEACSGDGDCKGAAKCCSNGCGHVCMKPLVNLDAVEKREPGGVLTSDRCPKPGRFGLCAELCGVGGGCSGGKICCS